MKIAIIQISEAGKPVADRLIKALAARPVSRDSIATQWKKFDAFVFIGAMGICVRTIAPYIKDKHEDPAVVCIDISHAASTCRSRRFSASTLARFVRLESILSA